MFNEFFNYNFIDVSETMNLMKEIHKKSRIMFHMRNQAEDIEFEEIHKNILESSEISVHL